MSDRALQVLSTVVVAMLAVGAWRATACNFRRWKDTRGLPLVIAGSDELLPKDDGWTHPRRKWPDPGGASDWRLPPEVCDAYARLAARRSRRWEVLSAGANLLVAALLGVVITRLGTMRDALTEAGTFDLPFQTMGERLASYWLPELRLTWVAVIVVAFLAAGTSNHADYGELSARYRLAARQQRDELAQATRSRSNAAPDGRLRRLVHRVRAVL